MTEFVLHAADQSFLRSDALPILIREGPVNRLSQQEIEQWRTLCASDFQFSSPLLTPDFSRFITAIRDDVRIILAFQDNRLIGVLPVHRRSFGHARPVGAPFSDYSGPLIAPGILLTTAEFIRLAGYSSFRAQTSIAPPHALSAGYHETAEGSYVIRLHGQTPAQYLESRRALHPKRFKNFRRLISKLEREIGPIQFVSGAPAALGVERLLSWKSDQFGREGLLDLTSANLSRAVLDHAIATPFEEATQLGGFMTGLQIDGKLIAGHFGVRLGSDFHPWISAFDRDLTEYSPGVLLLYRVIEEMSMIGLTTYDLAGGHDFYKKYFAEQERFIRDIACSAPTIAGRLQHWSYESWKLFGAGNPASVAARIRRRIDHAAASESGLCARVTDFLTALRKRSRPSEQPDEL